MESTKRNINDKNRNRKTDNSKDIELNKAQARVDAKELAKDMHMLISQPAFIRYVWRVMSHCGLYSSDFTGNSTTFFNNGQTEIATWMMGDLQSYSPRALLKIMEQKVLEIEAQQLKEMEK